MPPSKPSETKKRKKPKPKPGQKSAEVWDAIILEYCKLRAQGATTKEALEFLNNSGKWGKINRKSFYHRYTPWVKQQRELRAKEFNTFCEEAMTAMDILRRRAFAKEDHRMAKETILDTYELGKKFGIYPSGPPERLEIAGPGYFEAVSLAIDKITKKKEEKK